MHIARFLVNVIHKARPDINFDELVAFVDEFCPDARGYEHIKSYAVSLAEAAKLLKDNDFDYTDFVYSRGLDAVFFSVKRHTSHDIFMSYLWHIETQILKGKGGIDTDHFCDDYAEKYLTDCLGFFQSSAYAMDGRLKLSENFVMNFQEKQVFTGFKLLRIDVD